MKRVLEAKNAPAVIGPYSHGVAYEGKLVFTSGMIGLDPATGKLVTGGIEAEAEQALRNVGSVLEAGLSTFDKVLKTTIFLTDIKDFAAVNSVYARFFDHAKFPARTTVQVAALPLGARVEIECIASGL